MTEYLIQKVKTGTGVAGQRVAVLFAPPSAPAGSLSELTRFLNEQQGVKAIPGYHGPNQHHVLRISGFENDKNLMRLLRDEFPKWQAANGLNFDSAIRMDEGLAFEALNVVDHFPFEPQPIQTIKKNANLFTSISYMAGDIGLFIAAMKQKLPIGKGHQTKDWFRAYSSMSYLAAHTALIALGHYADNPRDVYSILQEVYPNLDKADDKTKNEVQKRAGDVLTFIKNHPWETYSAICATGSLSLMTSAALRKNHGEMAAQFGTFISALIMGLVPEKGSEELNNISGIIARKEGSMLASLEKAKKHYPSFAPLFDMGTNAVEYLYNKPLSVSAGLSGIGNAVFVASNVLKSGQRDLWSAGAGTAYLTGNYFQTHAHKMRGPALDEVASAAANIIYSDPNLPKDDEKKLQARVDNLVEALSRHKEIYHPKSHLSQAIKERIERKKQGNANNLLAGFIPEEKDAIKLSPFVKPGVVERVLSSKASLAETPFSQMAMTR